MMEFAQIKEQGGQRTKAGRQLLSLGGCWRRKTHFWEGRDVRNKRQIRRDSLGRSRLKKP